MKVKTKVPNVIATWKTNAPFELHLFNVKCLSLSKASISYTVWRWKVSCWTPGLLSHWCTPSEFVLEDVEWEIQDIHRAIQFCC